MKNKLPKDIQTYLKETARQIPSDYPNKRILLHMMQQDIENFLSEHPNASLFDITENFGPPSAIAASYLENLSGIEIAGRFRKNRIRLGIGIGVLLLCIVIFLCSLHRFRKTEPHTIEETLYIYDGTEMPEELKEILEEITDE